MLKDLLFQYFAFQLLFVMALYDYFFFNINKFRYFKFDYIFCWNIMKWSIMKCHQNKYIISLKYMEINYINLSMFK